MALDPASMAEQPAASGEGEPAAAVASSSFPGQQAALPPAVAKRKRNPPGMPDPEAEVVALSPEVLRATNRFMCEVCGKGFPRYQNLQLHRREHNLPWNLRGSGERPRKRVYVCPVPTCVYHDPARALGDLTGIKKHFFRKHEGERKFACAYCSKKYAVLSDLQAHMRACVGSGENGDGGLFPFSRRKHTVSGGAMGRSTSKEHISAEAAAASDSGMPSEQGKATSSPSQPVVTPVFQLQQLPATLVPQEQQQQGQLVLAGYLLFYDCNPQALGSTDIGK